MTRRDRYGDVDVLSRPDWQWHWLAGWWAVLTGQPDARLRVYVACRACHVRGEHGLTRRSAARALLDQHTPAGPECRELLADRLRSERDWLLDAGLLDETTDSDEAQERGAP